MMGKVFTTCTQTTQRIFNVKVFMSPQPPLLFCVWGGVGWGWGGGGEGCSLTRDFALLSEVRNMQYESMSLVDRGNKSSRLFPKASSY
jgi:hypothetical protein